MCKAGVALEHIHVSWGGLGGIGAPCPRMPCVVAVVVAAAAAGEVAVVAVVCGGGCVGPAACEGCHNRCGAAAEG